MDRRSFLRQGLYSTLPLLARPALSQQMAAPPISKARDRDLTSLQQELKGEIFLPGSPSYEKLRKGYAARYDEHPAFVARPANAQDIQAVLRFVTLNHLPVAIRCGGHSYAGYCTCEDGAVLDMSAFRSIVIAPDQQSVRIGGGVLSGALEIETAKVGRAAALGQCPSVGVGGFLLGGGVGPLMSKYGLGCDNVLSADLVLADGQAVTASSHQNPDLYWAIRGGGGNFGVVTAFQVALHPVANVFAGDIVMEAADPRDFLRPFIACLATAPDELTLIALMSAQPGSKPRLTIQACYVGDRQPGEKALAPLRHHLAVTHDGIQFRPYLELEQMVPFDIPPSYEEHYSGFFPELDEQRIDVLADAFANAPIPVECFLGHLHGAVTRVPLTATPFPLRSHGVHVDAAALWQAPDGQAAAAEWAHTLRSKLRVDQGVNYVNTMQRVDETVVRQAYGANYARLQQVKAHYDPQNLFSRNQNIRPA